MFAITEKTLKLLFFKHFLVKLFSEPSQVYFTESKLNVTMLMLIRIDTISTFNI